MVFDTKATPVLRADDISSILKAVQSMGGGTSIKAIGELVRVPALPAVWITDAYTGDGWPTPHTAAEVWMVYGDAPNPPTGVTIRVSDTT